MADQAARIGGATLTRNAEIVHTALIEMRGTTSPRLVLELLCARMQLPDAAADSAALLQRIERLERRNAAIAAPAELEPAATPPAAAKAAARPARKVEAPPVEARPVPAEPAKSAPAEPRKAVPAGAVDAAAIRRLWPEVLDIVKQASRRTRALLDNAQVASLDGDQLTLSATTAPLVKMIGDESNTELLRSALASVVGGTWRVTVELAGAPAADPTPHEPQPEPDPRDDSGPANPGDSAAADPEADALSLLQSTLGARPLDDASQ